MGTVRFAVIGCGRVAGNHLQAIRELPRAELVAVCDLNPERADPYGRQYGVPQYANYHAMLTQEAVDVVCILTPSGMHPTHAVDVMRRYRKHVVIEKPMAMRLADLDALRQAAAEAKVKVFPVYQNRYNKPVRAVRAALLEGRMGRPVMGTVRLRWCRPQRYYDRDPWRGTWSLDGGALTNQGIHYLDLLLYLMGDVEQVCAMTATQLVKVEVEDTAVAALRFASGALGVIEVTTAARPDDFEASVSVLTEGGAGVLGGLTANRLLTWTMDPAACEQHSEEVPNAYGNGHRPLLADVVADLLDGVPHPISFQEGARAIRFLNALYRSAEDNRPVMLKDSPVSRLLGREDQALHALYLTGPGGELRPGDGGSPQAAAQARERS